MHATPLMVLSLLVAISAPAYAQDTITDTDATTQDVLEEQVDEVVEETADEVVEDVSDAEEVAVPNLADIAAADPSLSLREGDDDTMVMLSDVLFEFGNDTLEPEALAVLGSVAASLEGVPAIRIKGHTDSVGDEESNRILSQQRANNVRDWLVANTNLSADVITAIGVGEADPIAENLTEDGGDNPDGRAQNRRVEFTLLGEN